MDDAGAGFDGAAATMTTMVTIMIGIVNYQVWNTQHRWNSLLHYYPFSPLLTGVDVFFAQ